MFKKINLNKEEGGFTLIELLVVIAIIGMLASVVLASMNTARKKARDARRISDIKSVVTALELYYTSGYPAGAGGVLSTELASTITSEYIAKLPDDPTYTGTTAGTDNNYLYGATTPVNGYAILMSRESQASCQFIEGTGYTPWDTTTYPLCSSQ